MLAKSVSKAEQEEGDMAKFFGNLNAVLAAGVVLLLAVLFGVQGSTTIISSGASCT